MNDDNVVYRGGAMKSLGGNRVGGLAIVFSGPSDPDRVSDYFDAHCDFDLQDRKSVRVLFHHGLFPEHPGEVARATFEIRPEGVWAETRLDPANRSHREWLDAVKANEFGWSSGSAAHQVKRVKVGKAYRITNWPVSEFSLLLRADAAEPRAQVVELKSLMRNPRMLDSVPDNWMSKVEQLARVELELGQREISRLKGELAALKTVDWKPSF